MPANRMKAEVASTLNVIGSSSAMVSAGPRPGSTPIAVPSVVPTRHHIRFIGVSAIEKPCPSCDRTSMPLAPQQAFDQTGADVDAKELGEAEIGDDGDDKADGNVAHNIAAAEAVRDQHEHGGGGGGETERHDQDHVDDEPGGDEAECAPVDRDLSLLLRLPAAARRLDDQENGEQREARRGNGGKYRRSDLG